MPPRSTSSQTNRSTDELAQIDDDIALQATIIAGHDLKKRGAGKSTPSLPTEAGIYAYLCYDKDGIEVEQFEIKDTNVVVGRLDPKRGLTPDIDLSKIDPDMTVSRKHARIHFENSRFYIEDLKSRNKTRLGELSLTPLQAELLEHGDIVRFGTVRLRFKVPSMSKSK